MFHKGHPGYVVQSEPHSGPTFEQVAINDGLRYGVESFTGGTWILGTKAPGWVTVFVSGYTEPRLLDKLARWLGL